MEQKKGIHWAWFVFVGVCMMMAGGMGLVLNVIGNYFGPMAVAFGLINEATGKPDVTQVTLLMTVYSYVMFVWLPFVGRLFDKIDARVLFGAAGILVVLGVALLGVWTEVWQIYISGVMWGLAGPIIFLVGPSFLINNWFAPKQAGKFLGIASAFTGFGAFVGSPTVAGLVASMGYQTAFFIEAVVAAVLILIPAFFLFRTRPEDKGLKQFGIEKELAVGDEPKKYGLSDKFALTTVAFFAILDLAMLGALMISAAAVGNIVGKIFLGTLSDIIGIRNGMLIFAALNIIGFAIMLFFMSDNTVIMLIAGFCIGSADAMMSVGLPLMTRAAYGDRQYAKIYSYLNMPIAVLGGLGATFVAFVGNLASFPIAYGVGIASMVVVAACCVIAYNSTRKYLPLWTYEGDPEKKKSDLTS